MEYQIKLNILSQRVDEFTQRQRKNTAPLGRILCVWISMVSLCSGLRKADGAVLYRVVLLGNVLCEICSTISEFAMTSTAPTHSQRRVSGALQQSPDAGPLQEPSRPTSGPPGRPIGQPFGF